MVVALTRMTDAGQRREAGRRSGWSILGTVGVSVCVLAFLNAWALTIYPIHPVTDSSNMDGTSPLVIIEPPPTWPKNASAAKIQSIRDLNILLYITTMFSAQHMDFFTCCWPKLMEYSHLLPNVHVMVFANNATPQPEEYTNQIESLFRPHNPSFQYKFATEQELEEVVINNPRTNPLQFGANLAPQLGFRHQWFQPYEWTIRINPDVLIRQSEWIVDALHNTSIDAIFVICKNYSIHTDFFAIRTSALWWVNNTDLPFSILDRWNHEHTAYKYFLPILESGRYALLPQIKPSKGICRIGAYNIHTGMVYHGHEGCNKGAPVRPVSSSNNDSIIINDPPSTCTRLEGWDIN